MKTGLLEVVAQAKHITKERTEHVLAFLIDEKSGIIDIEKVSVGTTVMSLAHPREIFRPALAKNAYGVILVHNHPSGDPTPSDEDIRLTKRVEQAGMILGIKLIDHIIVAKEGSYSLKAAGFIS